MISVVVPAYNEKKTITNCLKAIAGQDCELIVVVGGDDGTDRVAKKYGKVVRDNVCKGAGPARNQGAKVARGEVVLFTDGDTIVPENWVASYARVFGDNSVVAAGGVVRPLNGSVVDELVYRMNQDWLYRLTALFGFYQFSGNNCGYRRKAFLKENGFDEGLTMLEDTELPLRMKNVGGLVFDKSIFVETSPRRMGETGYLRVWLKFMRAYAAWFLLGQKPRGKYFASAK